MYCNTKLLAQYGNAFSLEFSLVTSNESSLVTSNEFGLEFSLVTSNAFSVEAHAAWSEPRDL